MKILTISSSDLIGGAARAAYIFFNSLGGLDLDSKMLVKNKASNNHSVLGPNTNMEKLLSLFAPYFNDIPKKYFSTFNENLHSPAWFSKLKANEINKILASQYQSIYNEWILK